MPWALAIPQLERYLDRFIRLRRACDQTHLTHTTRYSAGSNMSHSHAMQCATHLWRLALVLLEKFALPVPKKLLHLVQLVHAGQNVYVYIYKRRGCATAKRQMKRSRTKDATASRTTTLNRRSGACSIRCSRSDDALCLAGWRRKLIDIMHAPSAACTVHAAGRMLALARCCCCWQLRLSCSDGGCGHRDAALHVTHNG